MFHAFQYTSYLDMRSIIFFLYQSIFYIYMYLFWLPQLQPLLYKFRCRHLQQHLHYVIENAESKMSARNPPPSSQGKQPTTTKDVRSSLYARIGLTKEKENSKTVFYECNRYLSEFRKLSPFTKIYLFLFCNVSE